MSEPKCNCEDWLHITNNHSNLFRYDSTYGWLITWIELSKEKSHYIKHNYGIAINYCPFCGSRLT